MKREQIIEILETWDDYVLGGDINDDIADAILALTLDVPSDEEIRDILWEEIHVPLSQKDIEENTVAYAMYLEIIRWAIWMKEEIIKRNK